MEIDKKNASQVCGTTGVMWKVGGVRYNARWEEMEFVSVGEQEGDSDVYRVKKKVGRPPIIKQENEIPVNIEETKMPASATRFWSMKKEDVMQALRDLGVEFDQESNRNLLLNLLKQSRIKKQGFKNDMET